MPETVLKVDEPKPMAPMAETVPVAPKAEAAQVAPTAETESEARPAESVARTKGRLRRVDSVSLKMEQVEMPTIMNSERNNPPLTQEGLEAVWKDMLEAMREPMPKLYDVLVDKEVRLTGDDEFVLVVSNSYTENEIKNHLIRMLTYLRKRSGRPMLNCTMDIVMVERETKPYTARDKYDAMLQENPTLDMMRVLFPDVEM